MCTGIRFTDSAGAMYAGRNLDWECGYGEKVSITPRNYVRPYAFEAHASGFATIGTCIVVKEIPLYFDCGNEKGLYVAGLNFPGMPSMRRRLLRVRPISLATNSRFGSRALSLLLMRRKRRSRMLR